MTMQYDVKAAHTNGTGLLVGYRTRIKSIIFCSSNTAGTIKLTDGTANGPELFQIDTGTNSNTVNILLPGEGILASVGVYVATYTNVTSLTVIYG